MKKLQLHDFPSVSFDKLRYRDTDSQGHVTNAVFSSFLETGRVEILYNNSVAALPPQAFVVIASIKIDFFII